jgi:hypothetical protein
VSSRPAARRTRNALSVIIGFGSPERLHATTSGVIELSAGLHHVLGPPSTIRQATVLQLVEGVGGARVAAPPPPSVSWKDER